jgi:hypothetical protein
MEQVNRIADRAGYYSIHSEPLGSETTGIRGARAGIAKKIPWRDAAVRRFLPAFLYESLLTSDANAPVEISLRRGRCSKT